MQKTTLKEGAGTKIIIWQYHPLPPCSSCLIHQEEDGQQGGQSSSASLSSPVASAAGVSSRLALSAGISHSGRVPLHNTSPSWAPPPHLTLNKHPLHYPGLHKTEKVRYIQASLGLTLPSQSRSSGHQLPQQVRLRPRGPRERRGCRGQPRRRSPFPSPPGGEAHAGKEAEVPSSASAPPLSSGKREEAAREQQVVGKGKSRVQCLLSPVSAAFRCRDPAINSQGPVAGEGFSPLYSQDSGHAIPPLPLSPGLSQRNPFQPRLKGACSLPQPPPRSTASPQRRGWADAVCVHNPAPLRLPTGDPGAVPSAALQPHPIALCSS